MKYLNLDALPKLIQKYKRITLQDIKKVQVDYIDFKGSRIMKQLTNLCTVNCTLCSAMGDALDIDLHYATKEQFETICSQCVHAANKPHPSLTSGFCFGTRGRDEMTGATNAEELYEAIQERIDYLENELTPIIQKEL